jgi:hypothetical protein
VGAADPADQLPDQGKRNRLSLTKTYLSMRILPKVTIGMKIFQRVTTDLRMRGNRKKNHLPVLHVLAPDQGEVTHMLKSRKKKLKAKTLSRNRRRSQNLVVVPEGEAEVGVGEAK